jgi:hypothetical protein
MIYPQPKVKHGKSSAALGTLLQEKTSMVFVCSEHHGGQFKFE